MTRKQKETIGVRAGGLLRGVFETPQDERPTLSEAVIDKHLAARARKPDRMLDKEFEDHAAEVKRTKREAQQAKGRSMRTQSSTPGKNGQAASRA